MRSKSLRFVVAGLLLTGALLLVASPSTRRLPSGGGRIEGTMQLADGTAASPAEVTLAALNGPSFERVPVREGAFEVEGVPLHVPLVARVEGDFVLASSEEAVGVVCRSAEPVKLDLTVEPAGRVRGQVRSARGGPVAGARVSLFATHEQRPVMRQTSTDAAGHFELALRRSLQVSLEVRHAEHAPAWVDTVVPDENVVVTLKGGGALAGKVTDLEARPLEAIEVYANAVGRTGEVDEGLREYTSVLSDAQGNYRLERLNPGTYRVEVRWANTATVVLEAEVSDGVTRTLRDARLAASTPGSR